MAVCPTFDSGQSDARRGGNGTYISNAFDGVPPKLQTHFTNRGIRDSVLNRSQLHLEHIELSERCHIRYFRSQKRQIMTSPEIDESLEFTCW